MVIRTTELLLHYCICSNNRAGACNVCFSTLLVFVTTNGMIIVALFNIHPIIYHSNSRCFRLLLNLFIVKMHFFVKVDGPNPFAKSTIFVASSDFDNAKCRTTAVFGVGGGNLAALPIFCEIILVASEFELMLYLAVVIWPSVYSTSIFVHCRWEVVALPCA